MADQFGCAFLIRSFPFKLHVFQIPWPGRKMLSNICETLWTYTFLPFAIIRRMLNWVVVHRIKNDTNRPKVATTVVVFRSIRLLVGELRASSYSLELSQATTCEKVPQEYLVVNLHSWRLSRIF